MRYKEVRVSTLITNEIILISKENYMYNHLSYIRITIGFHGSVTQPMGSFGKYPFDLGPICSLYMRKDGQHGMNVCPIFEKKKANEEGSGDK